MSTDADGGTSTADGGSSQQPISSSIADATSQVASDAQWDDEALAAATTRKGATVVAASTGTKTKDWADLKTLDLKSTGNDQDNIAMKLQVEETRAQLAAAREGMEREAQRIKEEKERKEQEAKDKTGARFGGAVSDLSASGASGRWVPSVMRAGGLSMSDRLGGASGQQKINTEDENLFPDLASADAIMEKKKHEQPAYTAAKKTPVGGGATWGERPKLNLKPKSQPVKEEEVSQETLNRETKETIEPAVELPRTEDPAPAEETKDATPSTETEESASAAQPDATTAAGPIKPKQRKKKDINTFVKKNC